MNEIITLILYYLILFEVPVIETSISMMTIRTPDFYE